MALVVPDCSSVFTTADAYATGWSPKQLAYAARRERVIRLYRGVYVWAGAWSGEGFEADRRRAALRAAAAARVVGSAAVSHTSAALLDGLPTWHIPDRACLTVAPNYTGDSTCAHLHRAKVGRTHAVRGAAVSRLCATRTVLDMAREHGIYDAVVVGDSALHHGLSDAAQLARCAKYCSGWPGIRRGRHVLTLLDGRAESPLESVSRLRLRDTRLPEPDLQPLIFSRDGRFLGRPDFYWDEFGVAGEVDGRDKYRDDPEGSHWREKKRQEGMEIPGIVFVRWGDHDLFAMMDLVERVEATFRRGMRTFDDRGWIVRRSPPIPGIVSASPR